MLWTLKEVHCSRETIVDVSLSSHCIPNLKFSYFLTSLNSGMLPYFIISDQNACTSAAPSLARGENFKIVILRNTYGDSDDIYDRINPNGTPQFVHRKFKVMNDKVGEVKVKMINFKRCYREPVPLRPRGKTAAEH